MSKCKCSSCRNIIKIKWHCLPVHNRGKSHYHIKCEVYNKLIIPDSKMVDCCPKYQPDIFVLLNTFKEHLLSAFAARIERGL